MTQMTEYAAGQFSWVDLMAADVDRAKTFYGGLFGWDPVDQDTQGGPPYVIFQLGGRNVAGLGQLPDEMKSRGVPPCWNSYVSVDDVQAACARVEELGGTVTMPPMQVFEAGHMAGLQDPAGANLFLWQPLQHVGADVVNEPNTFCWNELATRNVPGAQEFFGGLFGWTFERAEGSPSPYFTIHNDGRLNGGIIEMNEQWEGIPPIWSVYFAVEDADGAAAKAESLGGAIRVPPFDIPVGRLAVLADEGGAGFGILAMNTPRE